ncbi:tyrosine phosphatase family domain-containing protein [Trichoderma austrokoningii]
MELDILPDTSIPLFSPEIAARFQSPDLFPTQLPTDESPIVIEGLSLATGRIKSQSPAQDLLLLSEDTARPLLQRRATSQQTSSMLPKSGAISAAAATGSVISITTDPLPEFPLAPMEGRPINFGLVVPGVYRSSYPKADDYDFLKGLKLKTVVTLVKRDEIDHEFESFIGANGVQQIVFNMKGTKKEAIPASTMSSILDVVMDRRNYPLLIHCNHGKHRTGCVVAAVRKLSGWTLDSVLDEYKTYAQPKIRECDVEYITGFEPGSLNITSFRAFHGESSRFTPVQVRSFMRTVLFTAFVATIWVVSGSRMVINRDKMAF